MWSLVEYGSTQYPHETAMSSWHFPPMQKMPNWCGSWNSYERKLHRSLFMCGIMPERRFLDFTWLPVMRSKLISHSNFFFFFIHFCTFAIRYFVWIALRWAFTVRIIIMWEHIFTYSWLTKKFQWLDCCVYSTHSTLCFCYDILIS